ncbi:GTPase Era [Paremcibacter congregatus]|uniref:GTPase Era n=1 Tax=Paremcibacter congregatus TaxID=2043170 RepID=A0A2G4YNE3_9PROT|nr:GTPase Era [Paremcibacter congregatus]PHZ83803.1 GTPase Era [Paremcibacter congregatus]QDE27506.1 GTPase Era [Paremcibacter congregatus]|tara:strand:- start:472 stop:1374 length:903 start_codon:yes stop_codon:yes gene_type:complete
MNESKSRCGFVALIGAPNAGKSTLINSLVGSKISIVTHKVQTTRTRFVGIALHKESQMIFVDTPGIFEPKKRLERAMVSAAWAGASDADAVVLLVDAARKIDENTKRIIASLKEAGQKAILALNKIDGLRRDKLLGLTQELNEMGDFTDTMMISALKGDGLDDLMEVIATRLPKGPWLYPEDQMTDITERMLAAEVTREKFFLRLHEELPYAATVETESWQEKKDGSVRIEQIIYVERDTQKAIVIGKGGASLKEIGKQAREELEEMLDRRVHLFIFVKVRRNWSDDKERYENMGLDWVE